MARQIDWVRLCDNWVVCDCSVFWAIGVLLSFELEHTQAKEAEKTTQKKTLIFFIVCTLFFSLSSKVNRSNRSFFRLRSYRVLFGLLISVHCSYQPRRINGTEPETKHTHFFLSPFLLSTDTEIKTLCNVLEWSLGSFGSVVCLVFFFFCRFFTHRKFITCWNYKFFRDSRIMVMSKRFYLFLFFFSFVCLCVR